MMLSPLFAALISLTPASATQGGNSHWFCFAENWETKVYHVSGVFHSTTPLDALKRRWENMLQGKTYGRSGCSSYQSPDAAASSRQEQIDHLSRNAYSFQYYSM